jgi:hypothetical protein
MSFSLFQSHCLLSFKIHCHCLNLQMSFSEAFPPDIELNGSVASPWSLSSFISYQIGGGESSAQLLGAEAVSGVS